MKDDPLRNEDNIRLSYLVEETMVHFPLVARKIMAATRDKRSPISSEMKSRLLQLLVSGQVTPTEISRVLCISKPNVTTLISKLIEDGLAQRSHDEKDRRVIYVTITEKGKKAVQRYRKVIKKYMLKVFEQFSADELKDILAGVEKFQSMLIKINKVI
jgi:DNA-binding MarR family transcriptional regulator